MTQAQYAGHRGKSPQYIGKLAKAGILVMRGRLVDAAAPDAVLVKKLECETRIGKLVPTDEVSIKWYTLGRQVWDRVLGISSKPALASPLPFADRSRVCAFRALRDMLSASNPTRESEVRIGTGDG